MSDVVEGRVPPHNLDAERAVLAMALLDSQWTAVCRQHVNWREFYSDAHARIFEAIERVDDAGTEITLETVRERLRESGRLEQVGGSAMLVQLLHFEAYKVHIEEHAAIVRRLAQRRRMIRECQVIAAEGYGEVADDWLDDASQRIFAISQQSSKRNPPEHMGELVPQVVKETAARQSGEGAPIGVPSGLVDVQSLLQDYKRGVMYLVAARPGMGKTAYAMQECLHIARERYGEPKQGAVFVSAEMPKDQLVHRAIANEARIGVSAIESGKMSSNAWDKFTEATNRLRNRPVALYHRPGIRLHEIRATVRSEFARLRRDFNVEDLGVIVVDYIQLLGANHEKGKSRDQEIGELSRGLVEIAGEFQCPVIALSQLNREVEKRKDRRPLLSDLRESGSLEQDAYGVIFLYRDDYYTKTKSHEPNVCEVIVAKHRNGAAGTAKVRWDGFCTGFRNLARD